MNQHEVVLVHLPSERDRLEALRLAGMARVVVVDDGPPPNDPDCLEDWVRAPVDPDELIARVNNISARAEHHGEKPSVDADGILRHRGKLVTLAPLHRRLVEPLLERRGAVVSREVLLRRAWPDGEPEKRNVLDVHVTRLRRVLIDVGLELKTVRRRGYLLCDRDTVA